MRGMYYSFICVQYNIIWGCPPNATALLHWQRRRDTHYVRSAYTHAHAHAHTLNTTKARPFTQQQHSLSNPPDPPHNDAHSAREINRRYHTQEKSSPPRHTSFRPVNSTQFRQDVNATQRSSSLHHTIRSRVSFGI